MSGGVGTPGVRIRDRTRSEVMRLGSYGPLTESSEAQTEGDAWHGVRYF